jgi:hypothetical protein
MGLDSIRIERPWQRRPGNRLRRRPRQVLAPGQGTYLKSPGVATLIFDAPLLWPHRRGKKSTGATIRLCCVKKSEQPPRISRISSLFYGKRFPCPVRKAPCSPSARPFRRSRPPGRSDSLYFGKHSHPPWSSRKPRPIAAIRDPGAPSRALLFGPWVPALASLGRDDAGGM